MKEKLFLFLLCVGIWGCDTSSSMPFCGDGMVQNDELCDDGNAKDSDFCASDCLSPGPLVRTFILAGQSNMDGYAYLDNLKNKSVYYPLSNVQMYWSGNDKMTELGPASYVSGRFGPELGVGVHISKQYPGQHILLIKHAWGFTDLYEDWFPGESATDTKGYHYKTLFSSIKSASDVLQLQNKTPIFEGFYWMQGESDGSTVVTANAYYDNLTLLIDRVRDDLSVENLPFGIGKIKAPTIPYRDIIRTHQEAVAKDVEYTFLVNTDDLEFAPGDGIHYGADGAIELGKRFVEQNIP